MLEPDSSANLRSGNTYVAKGVDALGGLLNLAADDLGNELVGELRQSAAGSLALNNLGHLLADGADLGRPGVGGLLDLVGAPLGEGNAEEAEEVVVGGLDNDVGLDEGLPLADEGAELVGGEVEAVEVGQTVLSLDLVHTKLDLTESVVFVVLQVGKGNLENPALERVIRILETTGAVHQSLSHTFVLLVSRSPIHMFRFFSQRRACNLYRRNLLSDLESGRCLNTVSNIRATRLIVNTFTEYSSFLEKGSTVLFLIPFLPFDKRLFLEDISNQDRCPAL